MSLSKTMMCSMPVWFHVGLSGEENKLNNNAYAKCLRMSHEILSIGQLELLTKPCYTNHRKRADCDCEDCNHNRLNHGCKKQFKCQEMAKRIMLSILPKWNPTVNQPRRIPALNSEQKATNTAALKKKEKVDFDPQTELQGLYNKAIRVFVKKNTNKNAPARQIIPPICFHQHTTSVTIAGSLAVDNDGAYTSGGGIWFETNDQRNESIKIDEEQAYRNSGELVAILKVTESTPILTILHLNIQSKETLETLTSKLEDEENKEWLETKTCPKSRQLWQAYNDAARGQRCKSPHLTKTPRAC